MAGLIVGNSPIKVPLGTKMGLSVELHQKFINFLEAYSTTKHPISDKRLVCVLSNAADRLQKEMGDHFFGLFLGGSYSLGLQTNKSDVDYMVYLGETNECDFEGLEMAKVLVDAELTSAGYKSCRHNHNRQLSRFCPSFTASENQFYWVLSPFANHPIAGDAQFIQQQIIKALRSSPKNLDLGMRLSASYTLRDLDEKYLYLAGQSVSYVVGKYLAQHGVDLSLFSNVDRPTVLALHQLAKPYILQRRACFPIPPEIIAAVQSWSE